MRKISSLILVCLLMTGCGSAENERLMANLQDELALAQSEVGEVTAKSEGLQSEINDLNDELVVVTGERDEMAVKLGEAEEALAGLEAATLDSAQFEEEHNLMMMQIELLEEQLESHTSVEGALSVEEEQVIDAIYDEARALYSYFDVGTLAGSENPVEVDGRTYYKAFGEFDSYDDFYESLSAVFSPSIVEDLMARGTYIDVDGALYAQQGDRGTDIDYHDESRRIIQLDEKTLLYNVLVAFNNESEEYWHDFHSFRLKLYEDGVWRFEAFWLVW